MVIGDEKIKQLQKNLLDIFLIFKRICEKHGLKYFLIGGSCLGAVRHEGFIPWDDDIDVGMMRDDYEEFCRIAQPLLPNNLFLQTWKTDPPYYYEFAKIRNSDTTYLETGLAHLKINHGVFIDIFPLDTVPHGLAKCGFRIKRALYDNYVAVHCANADNRSSSWKQKIIRKVGSMLYRTPREVMEKRDKLFIKLKDKANENKIANYYGAWSTKEIMPMDWFEEGTVCNFERLKVRIPKEYQKYLTQLYGNYMQLPPENKRVSHHECNIIDLEHPYTIYTNGEKKMKRVITYGTFDLLHYGHINILRRAKALGDYLIVGLSTDEFNWNEKRKKCYFSYEQRKQLLEAIRYVDLVIPETCWEQKKTDAHEYHIDTFVMGDDWKGKFDFLKEEGVKVVYLPRTPEISTTQIKHDLNETTSRNGGGSSK